MNILLLGTVVRLKKGKEKYPISKTDNPGTRRIERFRNEEQEDKWKP